MRRVERHYEYLYRFLTHLEGGPCDPGRHEHRADGLTGTVAMMNLCKIVEDGADLRGKKWPALQELACGVHLAMIPWLNPDGVERWPFRNAENLPIEAYSRCMMRPIADPRIAGARITKKIACGPRKAPMTARNFTSP